MSRLKYNRNRTRRDSVLLFCIVLWWQIKRGPFFFICVAIMSSLNITFQYMIFSNFVLIKSSRDAHSSCIMTTRLRYCISYYFFQSACAKSCHEYQIDTNRNTIHDPNHYKYPKLTQRFLFAIWWKIYSSSKWLHAKWWESHLWYEALYFIISFFRDKLIIHYNGASDSEIWRQKYSEISTSDKHLFIRSFQLTNLRTRQ